MNPMYACARLALCVLLAWPAVGAIAQPAAPTLHLRSLAASCAACHGTDGRAVGGGGMLVLRGLDKSYIVTQLNAFRDGTRPATVMQQIAKGYTPEQIEQLAAYFAAVPQ
jgi:sulfide dehydrogenase cytochrome subunit